MKNTVDPDSCDSIFHKPRGNPRPKDCLKRALELIDYEACLKEQEATRNIDIVSRRSRQNRGFGQVLRTGTIIITD